MGAPISLLGQARAFARDFPRDNMPAGYLWDVVDFVPQIGDTHLTGRGGWTYASVDTAHYDIETGILAPFKGGEQVLVQTGDGQVLRLIPNADPTISTWTPLGAITRAIQNPIWMSDAVGEQAIFFSGYRDAAGLIVATRQPTLLREGGPVDAHATHKWAPVGAVWQNSMVTGGAAGEEHVLRFSIAGEDLNAATSYEDLARIFTSSRITGLQAMRSMLLIFHPSSVERLRGSPLPKPSANVSGKGLILEPLFQGTGCIHPKSIVTWNDQCIFADEHGVQITDGATVKSLTAQGNISTLWRGLYDSAHEIICAELLDHLIVTVRTPVARPPVPYDEKLYGLVPGVEPPPGVVLQGRVNIDPPPPSPRPPIPPVPDPVLETEDTRPPVPEPPPPAPRPPVPDPPPDTYNTTLVCDLNRKQWFRFSNINVRSLFAGSGSRGMERVWGGITGSGRLARISPIFFPGGTGIQQDGDGTLIYPLIETPWYRLGQEGRKRVRFVYLSYDFRSPTPLNGVQIAYLTSPTIGRDYQVAGYLPSTSEYRRFRVPVNKFPYGIAFYVQSYEGFNSLRIYDLAVEAQAAERSRV